MANENWRPGTGKAVPTNTPIKVDSKFTTIGLPGAQDGWVPLNPDDVGQNNWFYRIDNSGRGFIKAGPSPQNPLMLGFDDYETINDAAADSTWASGTVPGKTGNDAKVNLQTLLQQRLEERAPQLGIIPSPTQPTPASAGAQSGTNPGPSSSGIGSTFDTSNTPALENLISQFEDDKNNSFEGIKQFLYYPSNIGGSGQDKITITQIEYVVGDVAGALTGTLGNRELDFNSKDNSKVRTLGMVTLPIPNELSEANQTAWGEDSLSSISAALMGAGVGLVGDVSSGRLGGTLGNLENFVKNITTDGGAINTRLKQFLTVNAAASVLKLGGINVNPEAYISRVTGTAINPNLELLFNGPKLRQFAFQFKLTPRDEKEARNIRSIIKFFKKGMAPRRSTKQKLSIFLGAPNVFRIKFTSGETGRELDSVGKIKTCALQSFSANYTPDGFYAAYNDPKAGGSQPIAVVINLGFAELTPIFNDEYDGDSPSVGPEFVQENAKGFNVDQQKSTTTPPPAAPPQGVAGNPLLNPRAAGQPPVLGGPGTAARAGQQGAFSEYSDGVANGTIPVNVPFQAWKRQKGYQ